MIGAYAKGQLSEKWQISGEVSIAGNNFSSQVLNGELEVVGNGQDNFFYPLGQVNLVEDSEQVFLGGFSQTKDVDYFINYKNGTIRFKNTPTDLDDIKVVFQYFDTNKEISAGDTEYSYATTMQTDYQGSSVNASLGFTYVDKEFEPLGSISSAKGNTIINTSVDYELSPKTSIKTDYQKHKQFKKVDQLNRDIFLHKNILDLHFNSHLFEKIDHTQSFSYKLDLQDPDNTINDDFTRDIDSFSYGYTGTYVMDNEFSSSRFEQSLSKSKTDFKDKLDSKETQTKSYDLDSKLTLKNVWLLGTLSVTPEYYKYISEEKSSSVSLNLTSREEVGLKSSIQPLNSLSFTEMF